MRRRGFLSLAVAVGAAAITEGCVSISPIATSGDFPVNTGFTLQASQTWNTMKSRNTTGQIIIGVKADQPGLGYYNSSTNSYSGFDILIAKYVAAQLGFSTDQIQFSTVASQNRETAIETKSVDLVIASYSHTSTRATEVGFAGPYLTTPEALLTRKGGAQITSLTQVTSTTSVCDVSNSTEINNVPLNNLTTRSTYSECATAVKTSQADVVYSDYALLLGYAYQDPNSFTVTSTNESIQYYGIGLQLSDQALQNSLDQILTQAVSDGTWQAIFNTTLGPEGFKTTPPTVGNWGSSS